MPPPGPRDATRPPRLKRLDVAMRAADLAYRAAAHAHARDAGVVADPMLDTSPLRALRLHEVAALRGELALGCDIAAAGGGRR